FHPTQHLIEVVCNGTTNPWGLDYNEDGQFFMTNNVQGHLWHVIPGARYQRMYGQDFNPYSFELMDMTADHYHWDTTTKWTESRDGKANDFGGGHSHVGALIYHGNNFPAEYRGKIFMCNTHGRRINVNRLDREGSGYVGRREPDFMLVKNPWFRGVDIKMGPEGAMYVADWSDNGECHDHDGIHRTSGRIYRIAYGTPQLSDLQRNALNGGSPLSFLNDDWLNSPDWFGRHARRIRQELLAEGNLSSRSLASTIRHETALQLLFNEAINRNGTADIDKALQSADPLLKAQAIQLAASSSERQRRHAAALAKLAAQPQPANVLLALVSVMQKSSLDQRDTLRNALCSCPDNTATIAADSQLTLMTWYAIEPVVFADQAIEQLAAVPRLQQFAARRIMSDVDRNPEAAARLLTYLGTQAAAKQTERTSQLLDGILQGLAGRSKVTAPSTWSSVEKQLRSSGDQKVLVATEALGVLFGNGASMETLRKLAADGTADYVSRSQAVVALAQAQDTDSVPLLFQLLGDRAVDSAAIQALASFDHADTAKNLLNRLGGFKGGNRGLAIDTLISRKSWAQQLIEAIDGGHVDARELTASQVRQLLALNDDHIRTVLEARWGVVKETPEARLAAIHKWQEILTPDHLATANLESGAELFKKSCATCHKLYGEGKTIAPDLTGANRSNLEYLLMNIIDPSAVVPKQFTTSVLAMKNGRVITGVIVSQTEQTMVVQTDKEQLTLDRAEIEEFNNSGKSLMPDGLLDPLTPAQVRDLFGFLMQRQ
ncbi:MAG: c-type cytochrome, partial [Planctomycetaceae bacterium]|nr:c-type cytochrome [Planctomycetaceae bacterium]